MSDGLNKHRENMALVHLVLGGADISEPTQWTRCPCCEADHPDVRKRRQPTAYVDDEANWITCCGSCFQDAVEHWSDMWSDYYSDCI